MRERNLSRSKRGKEVLGTASFTKASQEARCSGAVIGSGFPVSDFGSKSLVYPTMW
jgi:hypothetical protein